jgi:fluoride exporter
MHLLYIALGGSLGALARYGLSKWVHLNVSTIFPWGTLAVNLTGSFMIGFFFELFETSVFPADLRSFVTVGFLGAYTTFSTYSLESVNLLREGQIKLFVANLLLSTVLGLLLVAAGLYASRFLLKAIR